MENPEIQDPRLIDPPCLKRGLAIPNGEMPCQSCGGRNVKIKVFACQKWTLCTIKGPQPNHGQVCHACNDRSS